MSKIKRGKFSNYQFNHTVLTSTDGGGRNQRSRDQMSGNNISVLTQLDDYRRNNKVRLNEMSEEQIKFTLNMQELALASYKNRVKNNELYLNYERNPFLNQQKSVNDHWMEAQRENRFNLLNNGELNQCRGNKQQNIVYALNNLKQKTEKKNLEKIVSGIQKKSFPYDFKPGKLDVKKSVTPVKSKKERISENLTLTERVQPTTNNQQDIPGAFANLDHIVKMKEVNYFEEKMKKRQINLFSALHIKKGEGYTKIGSDFLSQHYFSFDSMMKQANSKNTVHVQEHISTASRKSIFSTNVRVSKKKKQQMYEELTTDIDSIKFEDLMGVANGRVQSETLYTYLRNISDLKKEQTNEDRQKDISYKKGQKNMSVVNDGSGQENSEIAYFKLEPYSKNQQKQHELSQFYLKKLQKILKIERSVDEKTIKDKKLKGKINKEKDQILKQQFIMSVSPIEKQTDVQRKIRISKLGKERCEVIKSNVVLSTLICKRVYENASKSKSHSKSKSKSKTSRWR